mmetsp:Transcript_29570/g.69629  ORF Transcript_29570/g.69629 Transcript_29570/m.69629 type:complete len:312 (-) Transcript_29570:57-992(-)
MLAEEVGCRAHELADEGVGAVVGRVDLRAGLARVHGAVLRGARVQWITTDLEAGRVARGGEAAGVEDDGDRAGRVEAATHRVQVELPDGDAHAPCGQVTQAQDAPAVGEDDALAVVAAVGLLGQHRLGVLLQHRLDVAAVLDGDVAATRVEGHLAELLARLAHGGRVCHRQQQRRVRGEGGVVDVRILGVQLAQVGVGPQVVPEAHDASCLNERLRHRRRRARGVEHLNLLRDGGLRVPGADAARLRHLLRQRERARHLGHGVAGEKRETDLGERVGRLLEDGLVDGLLHLGHDVVLVHVLGDLLRRRHGW